MDLITIMEKMLRHKLALLPVIALTALGVMYVVALKAPVYDTTANYILLSPPAAPTGAQLAADPKLGRISPNNPYLDFGDLSVVANLLTQVMTTDGVRASLVREGANSAYTVVPSAQFGLTTPMLQITGVGATPQAAVRTAMLVGQATVSEMNTLQAAQGVNPRYYVRPSQFTAPSTPRLEVSGKLRMLVGILALGVILTFLVLSVVSGLEERTQRKRSPAKDRLPTRVSLDTAASVRLWRPEDLPELMRNRDGERMRSRS